MTITWPSIVPTPYTAIMVLQAGGRSLIECISRLAYLLTGVETVVMDWLAFISEILKTQAYEHVI